MTRQFFPGAYRQTKSKRRARRLTDHKVYSDDELESEEWAPFPEDTRYSVSTLGRVKGPRGLLRTPACKARGYEYVQAGGRQRAVHHLVLITFVGPCPQGLEACHADDDRRNNRLSNLRWDTHQSNIDDKIRNGNARGRKPKLSTEQLKSIALMREAGASLKDIASAFSISEGYVSKIANRLLH